MKEIASQEGNDDSPGTQEPTWWEEAVFHVVP